MAEELKAPAEAAQTSAEMAAETQTPAPAETPVETGTTAAPTEAPATETTPPAEKPPEETGAGKAAVGVEGYERMRDEAIAAGKKKTQEKSVPAPAAETAPAPEETAAPTETPVTETTAPTETEVSQEEKTPERIRLAGLKDGHLVAAANTIAREEGISFTEAFARVAPRPAEAASAAAAAETGPQLRTRAEIDADIAARKAEKKQAAADLDTGKMYDADEAIETLRNELAQVESAQAQAEHERQVAEQQQFSTTVETSKAKAVDYWPEAGVNDSAFSKRMLELANEYEKDPGLKHMVSAPDAPFVFAQLVAKELGVLPKHLRKATAPAPATNGATQPSTSTATKPAPVNQRAVGRPTQPAASPASGAARTTQGEPEDRLGVDKIHSVNDYEKVLDRAKKLVHA